MTEVPFTTTLLVETPQYYLKIHKAMHEFSQLNPNAQGMFPGHTQRLRPDPDAMGQRVGDEMVIIHLRTNRVYELNSTGARVWELLADSLERSEIERKLVQEFDVEDAVVLHELDSLFASLHSEGLVTVRDD